MGSADQRGHGDTTVTARMTTVTNSPKTRLLPWPTPWPAQWPKPRRVRTTLTVVFLACFGCMGIAAGASTLLPDGADRRFYLLVLAAPLLWGAATILVLTRLRLHNRRPTKVTTGQAPGSGEHGLVIPYSRALAATYVLLCATTLVLFAVITSVGAVSHARGGELGFVVICFGFVVYLCWTLVDIVTGRLAAGAVILTPSGIFHRSWAFDSYLAWDQAVSVWPGQLDGQCITVAARSDAAPRFQRRSRLWKQPEYRRAPETAIRGMYLAIDPALAYHTVRFYHADPVARSELGTDAAVDRVRSAAVTCLFSYRLVTVLPAGHRRRTSGPSAGSSCPPRRPLRRVFHNGKGNIGDHDH